MLTPPMSDNANICMQRSDINKVLRLPLTEDNYVKHTVDLSLEYYRDLMTAGR